MWPKVLTPASMILGMSAVLDKSAMTVTHFRPSASIFALVSPCSKTSTVTTSAPASAIPRANPCPSPRAAPVTIATLPSSLNKSKIAIDHAPKTESSIEK